jgi:hypothetical protein
MSATATPNTTTLEAYQLDDYLVARFRASAADGATPDRPLNLGLLIDNSGSMDGERLTAVKRTIHAARELLRPADRITLVSFSDDACLLLNHLTLDADGITQLYNAVDSIRAEGSTNLSAGLEALFHAGTDYDTVILLTDGVVNRGLTATAGLRAMALGGAGGRAINALGYGADHNRALLRDIATESRGSYTYVDSDEILPVAIGDILSGLRTELLRDLSVMPLSETGWQSQEVGGGWVGPVVADRDYWRVFLAIHDVGTENRVRATFNTSTMRFADAVRITEENVLGPVVREQIIRARAAQLLTRISDAVENRRAVADDDRRALTELQTEIRALPTRPLLLRILGQLAEAEELMRQPSLSDLSFLMAARGMPATPPRLGMTRQNATDHLMARLASGGTVLSQQRGVYSQTAAEAEEPTEPRPINVSMFSSPLQLTSSHGAHERYTHIPTESHS